MRITDVMVGVFFIAASIMPATADGKRVPFVAKPDVLPEKISTVTSYASVTVEGSRRVRCSRRLAIAPSPIGERPKVRKAMAGSSPRSSTRPERTGGRSAAVRGLRAQPAANTAS